MDRSKKQLIVTPEQHLAKKGITFIAPPTILYCYSKKCALQFVKQHNLQHTPQWHRGELYSNETTGIIYDIAPGSAFINLATEELYTLGARSFYIIGFAGSLTGELTIGDTINSDEHTIYSTDDPYRDETIVWLETMKKQNVAAVDMETQALLSKEKVLDINTKSYLVITDQLTEHGWKNLSDPKIITDAYMKLLDSVNRSISVR